MVQRVLQDRLIRSAVDDGFRLFVALEAQGADPDRRVASALVDRLWRERRGAISVQVLQEFYVNVTRKVAKTIDPQVAVERLSPVGRAGVLRTIVDPNDVRDPPARAH